MFHLNYYCDGYTVEGEGLVFFLFVSHLFLSLPLLTASLKLCATYQMPSRVGMGTALSGNEKREAVWSWPGSRKGVGLNVWSPELLMWYGFSHFTQPGLGVA
jgi:hypothetical protein